MKPTSRLLSVLVACSAILGIGCDPGTDHAPAAPPAALPTTPSGPPGAPPTDWAPMTDDTWIRSGPTPVEAHGQLSVVGKSLVDQNGATVQLKGVSSMWLNWEADGFAENAAALVWMRDHWNVQLIRAAMGVEPAGAYLADPSKATQQVERIVANAVAAGVYVLIDWHDHNAHLNKAQAVAFFSQMAEKYKDVPNVLYEPFNEPEQVDWPTIKAYHETVVAAIRAADPDNVIILGTPNWSQYVDVAAASPVAGTNLMYTLHFYTCTHTAWLRTRAETALAAGLALFVTEWGASAADGGLDGKVCYAEATTWMNWLSSKQIGWSAWKLDGCNPDSTCLLQPGAPASGGWDAQFLHGHAEFVRDELRK